MSGPPSTDLPAPAWRFLLPAGLAELAFLIALGWWPGAGVPWVRLLLFGGAFTAYALAATRVKDARGGALLVWGVAIALRLALLPLEPALSGDVYRYLWDGHVQSGGFSPFAHAPLDPDLAGMRRPWFALIPDAGAPTPYPPLAQLVFLALSVAGGAVLQAKLLWIGLDLGTGWLLGRIALHTGRSRRLTQLLYLWSPLLVVEVAWSGHLAPLALFPLALLVLLARVPAAAGAAAGLSAMVAPISFAAVPALTRRLGYRFLLGCAAGVGVAALPYALSGLRAVGGPFRVFHEARFLEGPFLLLESAVPGAMAPRYAALAVVLGVSAWGAAKGMRAERALLWVLGAALLVTPVLRPWYALWILPFAALRISKPWLLFTGLVFLAYAGPTATSNPTLPGTVATGGLPVWVHLAVWLPLLTLLAREGHQSWTERFPAPISPNQ